MPSFLSKVFGRKKDDKDASPTNRLGHGELLGGKFEAISPNVSPTAAHFLELQSDTANLKVPVLDADSGRITNEEKESGLSFFRIKSRPSSPEIRPKKLFDTLPPLSLDFDLKDKSAYNGYIFEESNSEAIFSDDVLGQRRLNPMEAIVLFRACSKAIVSRGLETLGIMTPHWYSASSDVQRRLISNFLRSLDLTTSSATATPSSPYITNFEDEVNFTRSIHDVAAVLRWGLRHVQLEGDSFGTNDGWYKAFFDAEAANDYPPKAFSEKLAPNLPTSHLDLLTSTLEVFSSLAAFSEANSTSGSKLSKIFGFWLLTARRIEDKDDWRTFYTRWERTGRMLEHLFLARIRNESTDQRMPTRLLELVHNYPFTHGLSPPTTDLQLLPYPQFTTATYPALFVRVQYEVTSQERIPKKKINPSALLADAFSTKVEEGEFVELWAKITSAASKTGSELPLGNVLANESLRLLSLVDKPKEGVKSPALSVISLVEPRCQRASSNGAASDSLVKPSTESAPLSTTAPLSPIGSDWEQFSASGFLDIDQSFPPLVSTLFDTDVEKTEPRDIPLPISRKSSKRTGRKSVELPRSVVIADSSGGSSPDATHPKSSKSRQEVITASQLEVIGLDEAFVEFWSDALLDPIASDWPAFVVCKFKPTLVPGLTFGTGDETTKKTLKWLILEQVYTVKPRPIPTSPLTSLPTPAETSTRPASPIAQTPTGRRLFNFWSISRTSSSSSTGSQKTRKIPKTPKVGEMGELIEEDEGKKDTIHVKLPSSKKFKSLDLPGVKRSTGKKSYEKKSIHIDAEAMSSSTIVAAGAAAAATTTAVRLATEKQEIDVVEEVGVSATPKAVAESSERGLVSESTDDSPKQDVVPELPLADVEKAGVVIILDTVPEQDAQIVDPGAPAEPAPASIPETTIVADDPRTKEQTMEGGTTLGEDVPHHPQEEDQYFIVSAGSTSAEPRTGQQLPLEVELPVQQDEEVDQRVSISSEIDEPGKTVLDEMIVVSEELQVPLITGKDEQVEISEANGGEHEIELEGGKEGALESLMEPAATLVSESETQVKEADTNVNEPAEDANKQVLPGEDKSEEAIVTLQVADGVGTETSVPTLPVSEPVPIVDGPITTGRSVAPTEVDPAVEDTEEVSDTVEEIDPDESFVGGVPASGDPPSVIVNRVEEVLPAAEPTPPILDNTSIPTQAAEEFLVAAEMDVPQTVSPSEVGGAPIVKDSLVTEFVTEAISQGITPEISAELATDESQAPEALSPAVEEPESSVDAPVQETSKELPAEPETLEQITTDHSSIDGSPVVEFGVDESLAASEAPIDVDATFVEERSREACAVEPELPVEVAVEMSSDAEMPETQEAATDETPVSGGPDEEPNDAAREMLASEDILPIEAPLLETSLIAVEPEEVTPAEPTSEEPSEQFIGSEDSVTETVPAVEVAIQELPVFEEEIPTRLGSVELPLAESQTVTEGPHEVPAVETKLSEEIPSTEPGLPIEEPGVPSFEVIQVADATNEAPFSEDALLAEPEREAPPSEVGEGAMPTEETLLEVPESAEESLELALPTFEDETIPLADALPIAEVTPPTEVTHTGEVTATSEELAEETPVGVGEGIGPVQRTTEATSEIKESDAPPENVAASVPEVSEEPLPVEGAIPVAVEESVAPVMSEPEVPSEAVAETLGLSEVVEGDPEVDEAVNVDSMKVAEPPTTKESPVEPVVDSAAIEQPSPSILSATDAEKIPLPESSLHLEEMVSPLVDDLVSDPEEEPPVIAEVPSPDAGEDPVPVTEMPPAIAEQPTAIVTDEALGPVEASSEGLHTEPAEPPETSSSEQPAERGDNINANPGTEVLMDIDQPIHSQVHPAVEGGIIDEPIVESTRDDLSIEKSDKQTAPDAPVANSITDASNESSDEERTLIENRNKPADVTANTLDPAIAGTTSISEKEPSESPPPLFDPSSIVEPDIVPGSLVEPSPESVDPAPIGEPTNEFPASPEHVVHIDTNKPDEVDEVPTEDSRDVAESSEEPAIALSEEPELASELPNGVSDSQTAIETIDTKAVVDAASEPDTAVEKLEDGKVAIDVEATVDPVVIAETQ